jgi:hypothetical protein
MTLAGGSGLMVAACTRCVGAGINSYACTQCLTRKTTLAARNTCFNCLKTAGSNTARCYM